MDRLTVATLIAALHTVGQVYRNKDGSEPADAVKKLLQQFDGAEDMTLAEWVETRLSAPKKAASQNSGPPRPETPSAETITADQALAKLEQAQTQAALREIIGSIALSADEWSVLAKRLTGMSARSGKAARNAVETYFSDKLLLDERVASVKRQFGRTTPPPADA
jgi:hypothetical protein